MTKKKEDIKPVEIVYIIDRSGSMSSIRNDAIGGFNASLTENQKLDEAANVTVVLFDDQYEFAKEPDGKNAYYRMDLKKVPQLTEKTFVPRGMTALNDAIGRTLTEFKRMKVEGKIDKAIFCILTDGGENSSREFSSADIKKLREDCEKEFAWDFLFLAANQDAFSTNHAYGFSTNNVATYGANSLGVATAFAASSGKMKSYRSATAAGATGEDLLNATRASTLQDDVTE